ncbi:hypothetical protein VP01_136g2 [Puccinia sorghi]|uniref:Uncharacterized protein n=1 Tax=Puccinia sorghi TaxID=27349 RepID=A0A0L6VLP2_9BASI|nr:hypothetical protein VP01_136g2 [Puccinia sorghi]
MGAGFRKRLPVETQDPLLIPRHPANRTLEKTYVHGLSDMAHRRSLAHWTKDVAEQLFFFFLFFGSKVKKKTRAIRTNPQFARRGSFLLGLVTEIHSSGRGCFALTATACLYGMKLITTLLTSALAVVGVRRRGSGGTTSLIVQVILENLSLYSTVSCHLSACRMLSRIKATHITPKTRGSFFQSVTSALSSRQPLTWSREIEKCTDWHCNLPTHFFFFASFCKVLYTALQKHRMLLVPYKHLKKNHVQKDQAFGCCACHQKIVDMEVPLARDWLREPVIHLFEFSCSTHESQKLHPCMYVIFHCIISCISVMRPTKYTKKDWVGKITKD